MKAVVKLEARVRHAIEKYHLLEPGEGLVLAVSGGPDSTALLHLFSLLSKEFGWRLAVAHVSHGLRGEEAREDARFVARMAGDLGIAFYLHEVDIPARKAAGDKGNIEALGREERYAFFSAVVASLGFTKVATGHTRDDQAETLLMRLLRGSGRGGLSGIAPIRRLGGDQAPVAVIRPFIEASRAEVTAYLKANGLEYRIDRTNLEPVPLRNWVRLVLLPQLRERAGLGLDERLGSLARILREEDEHLDDESEALLAEVTQGATLLREPFLRHKAALQRRMLRLWLRHVRGDLRGIGLSHIEAALRLIAQPAPQASLSLPRGWNLVRCYDRVILQCAGRRREAAVDFSYELPREGKFLVPEAGVTIELERSRERGHLPGPQDLHAVFDPAALPGELWVRNFRAGDRFRPLGMAGHKKVKDLFIEKKVPREVRRTHLLLVAEGEVIWIPGYGRSEVAKVSPHTQEFLQVRLIRSEARS